MASDKAKLTDLLKQPGQVPVYLFASTQQQPLREAAQQVLKALREEREDYDYTTLDGPAPDMGEVIEAAGTISLFGTPRVVELKEISTGAMGDKDIDELGTLFGDVTNAVLLITLLHKDKRAAGTKKAKDLLQAAAKVGYVAQLEKPTEREDVAFVQHTAQQLATQFAPGAAQTLVERAGDSRPLLQAETQKLAAIAGYTEITRAMVERYSTHNIEADVFQLARLITSRRKGAAFEKLAELLALRHEPVAIAAALAGTYVDMYRVRCGAEAGRSVATIFKEMGYKGNDYRLQKSKENAARYTTAQLEQCILLLYELDTALKSSALPDKGVLLQAAMAGLMQVGERK